MTKRVVSIGEPMLEVAPDPSKSLHQLGFAGDTFNTAWYMRKFLPPDWHVCYYTIVGDDDISRDFLQFTEAAGLITDQIGHHDTRTIGLYLVHIKDGERSFSYWRGESAAKSLADDRDKLQSVIEGADVIYFSGITVAILDNFSRKTLFSVLQQAKQAGKSITFDTNLRPKLWNDLSEMRENIAKFATLADMVLPSFDDECEYFGDTSPEETLNRYLGYGVKTVVIKNGHQEILATDGETGFYRHVPAPVPHPVDTTAAGDSFNAAFLSACLTKKPLCQSIDFAASIAANVICGTGALVEIKNLNLITK